MREESALLKLGPGQAEILRAWLERDDTPESMRLRARAVLGCAEHPTLKAVSQATGISIPTIEKWRRRYEDSGLIGLFGNPFTERLFDDTKIVRVAGTLRNGDGAKDDGAPSTRQIADLCGISQSTASRIQRALSLECPIAEAAGAINHHFEGWVLECVRGVLMTNRDLVLVLDLIQGEFCSPEQLCGQAERGPEIVDLLRSLVGYVRVTPPRTGREEDEAVKNEFMAGLGPVAEDRRRAIILGGRHAATKHALPAIRHTRCEAHVVPLEIGWFRIARVWLTCLIDRHPAGFEDLQDASNRLLARPSLLGSPFRWLLPDE